MTPILGVTASQISGHLFTSPYWIQYLKASPSGSSGAGSIALDSLSNIYTLAYDSTSVILIKCNSTGSVEWARKIDNMSYAGVSSNIRVDSSNNIYIVGTKTDLGYIPIEGLISKYNSSGVMQWQAGFKTTKYINANSIAVDSSGNVYVTGSYGPEAANTGTYIFTIKYNSSGVFQWQRNLNDVNTQGAGFEDDSGNAIAVDSSGNVYIGGKYKTTRVSFNDRYNAFVAKYNTSGVFQWQRYIQDQTTQGTEVLAITVDASANVYVTGEYVDPSLQIETFIAKYNTSGTIQWHRLLTSADLLNESATPAGISVDSSSNIYVTGSYGTYGSYENGFIAKYNTSGVIQWQRNIKNTVGSFINNGAVGILANSSTNIYISGTLNGSTVIATLPNTGASTGTYTINSENIINYSAASLVDSVGNLTLGTAPLIQTSVVMSTFESITPADTAVSMLSGKVYV